MNFGRAVRLGLIGIVAIALFAVIPLLYQFDRYYDGLEQEVVARFSGRPWTIPSTVYSDSTVVYPGQKIGDLGLIQRLARLNYHRVDSGQVRARGEYSYELTKGRLVIFLHSFRYPDRQFPGALIALRISPVQTVIGMEDESARQPIYSLELEPELLGAIFQGDWEQRRSMRCWPPKTIGFTSITGST
jgi:penicillin-binding protein 1B